MDFEQNTNQPEPMQPAEAVKEPARKGAGWRILLGIMLALSIMANIALFFLLIGAVTIFTTGQRDTLTEELIQKGPRGNKIAIIKVEGIIDGLQAKSVHKQLKRAKQDRRVKGLIINVNSPGGTLSGSDQIYNEIRRYRNESGRPVVAFMQSMAASGGYYTSVACDKIVAEPTTITGSVGVIMSYLVLQELLEGKLGIQPVIIKSGEKKDWPSSFRPPTEEQLQYLQEKLIIPAYNRFVQIVDEGRPMLTLNDVKRLADGSIYGAKEAVDEKLIDKIGYLDDAIEQVKSLADIEEAQVVEYRKPFRLADFLNSRSRNILRIDKTTLYELSTPQLLYLWTIRE